MTARQGRVAVVITVVLFTILLGRAAMATGNWIGFVVTEVGILVPMAISWWILRGPSPGAVHRSEHPEVNR